MSTNKRTSSSLLNDDNETKKLKTDSSSSTITPTFIDKNTTSKQICPYGESCYRQKNSSHTDEYSHSCK